jgi:ceramide glucosyltransferase
MVETLLLMLIIISWVYWLIALLLVFDFFRSQSEPDAGFQPPVSVLKPVKGVDFEAYQNFASFCAQDYPDYELIFGVADPEDPIIPIIERLKRDFPERPIRLIVAAAFGANHKASLLHHLALKAKHEILVVNDSDMRVTPDYLKQVVSPLIDEQVGLVTCPYQGELPLNITAGLEALHMGVTFLPSVLMARKVLDMRFAMGSTITLRQQDLAHLGGFTVLSDYLADDYQLGARIAALGLKVRLSNYVIACILGATTFHEQWAREVRWMRCIRVSRPFEYPGLLLSYSVPLSVVLAMVDSFGFASLRILVASLLLRWVVAWLISLRTGDRQVRHWLPWLPARDLLSAATWCVGGLGRQITWREETFVLQPDGRMRRARDLNNQALKEKPHRRFRWF